MCNPQHDEDSFDVNCPGCWQRYHPTLMGWARSMLRTMPCGMEAEDAVAELTVKLIEDQKQPDNQKNVRGWLRTLLKNLIIDQWRKPHRKRATVGMAGTDVAAPPTPAGERDVDSAQVKHRDAQIARAFEEIRGKERICPRDWHVFHVRFIEPYNNNTEQPRVGEVARRVNAAFPDKRPLDATDASQVAHRVRKVVFEEINKILQENGDDCTTRLYRALLKYLTPQANRPTAG